MYQCTSESINVALRYGSPGNSNKPFCKLCNRLLPSKFELLNKKFNIQTFHSGYGNKFKLRDLSNYQNFAN